MKYYRIFVLHLQQVFEQKGQTFVWILLSFMGPLLMILFWRGAKAIPGWTIEQLTAYYFLIIIVGAFVMTHIEERIGKIDIQEGQLTMYLLKPFSYFWFKFYYSVPNRILQGIFGSTFFLFCVSLFPSLFSFNITPAIFLFSFLLVVVGFFMAFLFKVIIGIMAFWMTEAKGLFEVINIIVTIFAGYLMPIALFPQWLQDITFVTPFPYMIYYPVIAFTGKLQVNEMVQIFLMQLVWVVILYFVYRLVWTAGIKKFSAVGQ